MHPRLTFFVELADGELDRLLQPELLHVLEQRGASLAVGMLDLTDLQAVAVRRALAAGVPVTAWLLLDRADGYWLTLDNFAATHRRWLQTLAWMRANGLQIQRIGLDVEAPHDDAVALVQSPIRSSVRLVQQRRKLAQLQAALADYAGLVAEIRAQGMQVESYQIPLLADERRAGTTILQRATGIVDIASDLEVLMLYRSAVPAVMAAGLVAAYGRDAKAIAVGITGGGVRSLQGEFAPRELDAEAAVAELRQAARFSSDLYVFSLEGCAARGAVETICAADLSTTDRGGRNLSHWPALTIRAGLQRLMAVERWVHALRRVRAWLPLLLLVAGG